MSSQPSMIVFVNSKVSAGQVRPAMPVQRGQGGLRLGYERPPTTHRSQAHETNPSRRRSS
jgi:hypothetical protein